MPTQGKRSLSLWSIILIMVLLLGAYGLIRPLKVKPFLFIEGTVLRSFSAVIRTVSTSAASIRSSLKGIFHASRLKRENEQFHFEIRLNKIELDIMNHLAEENQRLRQLMKLSQMKDYPVQYADLVYREGSNPYNFAINKGLDHGISLHQAVVYPIEVGPQKILYYQLIGRIVESLPHQSRVLSILDDRSQISVRNWRNHTLETVRFHKGDDYLSLTVHQDNHDFQVGDLLITSELSTLPKGLVVGIVKEIQPSSSLYKKIFIALPLPLMNISEVGVLN